MKTQIIFSFLIGLLTISNLRALEVSESIPLPLTKGARHTIMPFIGYQTLDGEQMGFILKDEYFDPVSLSYYTIDENQQYEQNKKSPEIGVIYRYQTPIDLFKIEAGLSMIHDAENYKRNFLVRVNDYSTKLGIQISHSNTIVSSLSLITKIPTGLKFISSSLSIGGGYAKRNVKGTLEAELSEVGTTTILDSEELLMIRVGLESSLWSKDNFLIKGSVYYTQMSPLDDRNDSFGGMGWSIGFFPIWSERR